MYCIGLGSIVSLIVSLVVLLMFISLGIAYESFGSLFELICQPGIIVIFATTKASHSFCSSEKLTFTTSS